MFNLLIKNKCRFVAVMLFMVFNISSVDNNNLDIKIQKKNLKNNIEEFLYSALSQNRTDDLLQALFEEKINFFNLKVKGTYPIGLAVQLGHKDLISYLVSNSHNVINKRGDNGLNAFHELMFNKAKFDEETLLNITDSFVRHGASLYSKTKNGGYNVLHIAASLGYSKVVKYLINKNINLARDNENYPPLCINLERDNENLSAIYINLDETNNKNWSALYIAILFGHIDTVKLLIEHGASLNLQDNEFGFTPLCVAVGKDDVVSLELLLKYGADINKLTLQNKSALDYALDLNSVCAIPLLFADSKLNGLKYLKYQ